MPKRKRYLDNAGKTDKGISDVQYYNIMHKVANDNYKNWGFGNPTDAYNHAINDITYDYRGYYNKYPNGKGNAVDHWTDEFKTVYHPTFSKESKYSGKKSKYNPKGLTGGTWYGDMFIPSVPLLVERSKYKKGGNKDAPNIFKYTSGNGNVRYAYRETPDAEEIAVRPLNTIFPDPAQWTFTDDNGRFYTPRRTTPIATAELNPDNRSEFERAVDNYIGEATNTIPKGYHTLPAIGAIAGGLAYPALAEAVLTSAFGAHGLTKWINGEINGPADAAMTALEIAPLGRLARPLYEGVVKPGMRLFNSPLTGNWTKIGNREYRLSPNGLGANGNSIESRVPQITAENAASITPEQWTAAQDAAIARGDMAEAQRLRDLHFKVSAPNTKVVDTKGNPQLVIHKTPNDFTVFDNSRSIGNLNWAATPKAFEGENGVFATGAGPNPKDMPLYVNMRNPHYPTIEEGMEPAFINEGEDGILGIVDKDMTDYFESSSKAGEGFNMSLGVDNPYALKLADAVTYDNNGVRIPLGKRDNFNIKDIRYAFAPTIGGSIGYTVGKKHLDEQKPQKRDGGSIHIAPSKRGTFTAAATKHGMGVQEFASKVLRNKEDYSPSLVKKANFARNASKWH